MARARARRPTAPREFQFTTAEIDRALEQGSHTDELKAYFGTGRFAQLEGLAARRRRGRGPRVLILPGIMGSILGSPGRFFDHVVWLNPFNIARGQVSQLALDDHGNGRHQSLDAIAYYYYFLRRTLTAE